MTSVTIKPEILRWARDRAGLHESDLKKRFPTLREWEAGTCQPTLSQAARVSKRFARALVESTLEGQTLYRDAMKMLGLSKVSTFHKLANTLNVIK